MRTRREDGIPWTTSWLIEVHRVAGKSYEVLGGAIELLGGHAGAHLTRDQSQRLRHDAAGGSHRLDLARRLDGDHRPMMRWTSVAILSTVPVPGTRRTMPRWAKCAMSGAVSR